jgi:hypothetical protein
MKFSIVTVVSVLSGAVSAKLRKPVPPPLDLPASHTRLATNGNSTFQQLLDHNNPSLGTFSQSYWYNFEFWKGPGSPVSIYCQTYKEETNRETKVVLFTPGEEAAAGYVGYLTNETITGAYAQAIGGAAVLIERGYTYRLWMKPAS